VRRRSLVLRGHVASMSRDRTSRTWPRSRQVCACRHAATLPKSGAPPRMGSVCGDVEPELARQHRARVGSAPALRPPRREADRGDPSGGAAGQPSHGTDCRQCRRGHRRSSRQHRTGGRTRARRGVRASSCSAWPGCRAAWCSCSTWPRSWRRGMSTSWRHSPSPEWSALVPRDHPRSRSGSVGHDDTHDQPLPQIQDSIEVGFACAYQSPKRQVVESQGSSRTTTTRLFAAREYL
jgi:hypothetical protein